MAANGPDDAVALSYDATGRLTRTVHNGEVIDYLYDGDELVAEYSSSGTLLRRFIHGFGNDDPVIRYEGAGVNARRYLLADERGSIMNTTKKCRQSILKDWRLEFTTIF